MGKKKILDLIMLIFTKKRLVFFSVPKTGSTAYEKALEPHASIILKNPPVLKHMPIYRYNRFLKPLLKQIGVEEIEFVAVMREPLSWLGSWYRYRKRPFLIGHPNSTANITFNEFIEAYINDNQPSFASVGNQYKFLKSQSNNTMHLFRYEDLKPLNKFLENRLNIVLDIRRYNESPKGDLFLSKKIYYKFCRKNYKDIQLYNSY